MIKKFFEYKSEYYDNLKVYYHKDKSENLNNVVLFIKEDYLITDEI